MKVHQSPADARPFQCRADLERDATLDRHYRDLGIRCVVAAVAPTGKKGAVASKPANTNSDKKR